MSQRIAVVTGASSGIGASSAIALAKAGYDLVLGARRQDRLLEVSNHCKEHGVQVSCFSLDVTSTDSVHAFFEGSQKLIANRHITLINNAGMAKGVDHIKDGSLEDWETVIATNLTGLLRITRAFLPLMTNRKMGHIINIGSIAGRQVYEGGGVYCATKYGVRALTETLKLELNGTGVRVTTVDPGMVQTEFSDVRLSSPQKAAEVYQGIDPLTGDDIGECVRWVATLPDRINIDSIVVTPADQATVRKVHRNLDRK